MIESIVGQKNTVYMLGYGGRRLVETLRIITGLGVRIVVDVRRWAQSRRAPEYSRRSLEQVLSAAGVGYVHVPSLGGYRAFGRDVPDMGWFRCYESEGFRAYATYLVLSRAAWNGLETIWYSAPLGLLVLCRERLPWRCHRKIIADWLVIHGFKVIHVIEPGRSFTHKGTRCIEEMREKLLGRLRPANESKPLDDHVSGE